MYEAIVPRTAAQWKAITDQKKRVAIANARIKNKRSAPQETWVNRLSYHNIVSNYTGGNTVNRLSGSSITREMRNEEKFAILSNGRTEYHAVEVVKRSGITAIIPAWVCPGLLTQDQVEQIRNGKRVSHARKRRSEKVHVLSDRSKSVVRARFTAYYRACGNRKTFCTLTFINDVTDADGIGVLNKFLTALREKFPRLSYIWVAERQENGRIHFHIIVNVFLPIQRINALWVRQQYRAGIRFPEISSDQIDEMTDKDIHGKLNPVDVRRVKNISALSSYLTKYISKGNNKGGFGCAVWHCSREVSQLCLRTIVGWEVVQLAKSEENARFNRYTGEYFGAPTVIAGRTGKKGGFMYIVYPLNQPGRFLCYLREMEQINKWILSGEASRYDVMEYLRGSPVPDSLYCLN
jgi:hypothetical protein